jgi:KDO2-lipid IV(A) lauroyltransferase
MAKRSAAARRANRALVYPLEAAGAVLLFGFFRLLPLDAASGFGGWLGRTIGPRLGITRRAVRNIQRALPEISDTEIATIITEMWDNLGRVVGEYPHLDRIGATPEQGGRVTVEDWTLVEPFRGEDGAPCIFFSGHFANWETFALTARNNGLGYAQIYRPANNPWVDAMMRRVRRLDDADIAPKGAAGARKAVRLLKAGKRVGMLIDQKLNDGIDVPFFGRGAMTAPAPALFALRLGCALVPVRIERIEGCHFRVSFLPPLTPPDTGDRKRDVAAMMGEVNRLLEGWIRERPGQWLWLHRRWPDS